MTTLQYLMCLVYSIDAQENRRIAALIDSNSLRFLGYGIHTGDGGFETAIVNVLQNSDYDMAKCWIISTYTPTEMCLGMASIRNLNGLAFLDTAKNIRIQFEQKSINRTDFQVAENVPGLETVPAWPTIGNWYGGVEAAQRDRKLTRTALNPFRSINECYGDERLQFAHRKMPDDIQEMLTTLPTDPAPATLSAGDAIQIFVRLACAIVGESWTPLLRWNPRTKPDQIMGGTNIGSVMVHNNRVIGWGLNLLSRDKSFHAETIMLQSYLLSNNVTAIPEGCQIYTSLQPCRMCASFIARAGKNVRVYYALRDQGLTTVLTHGANGCSESAAADFAGFGTGMKNPFQAMQHSLGRGVRTPEFLAAETPDNSRSNFFLRFGREILGRQNFLASQSSQIREELSKIPKPPNEAKLREQLDTNENLQKALDQAISLLKIVGMTGMATNYGWDLLEAVFPELQGARG